MALRVKENTGSSSSESFDCANQELAFVPASFCAEIDREQSPRAVAPDERRDELHGSFAEVGPALGHRDGLRDPQEVGTAAVVRDHDSRLVGKSGHPLVVGRHCRHPADADKLAKLRWESSGLPHPSGRDGACIECHVCSRRIESNQSIGRCRPRIRGGTYLDDAVQGEAEALMEIRQPLAVCDAVQAKGKSGREDSKIPVDL